METGYLVTFVYFGIFPCKQACKVNVAALITASSGAI